MFEMLVEAMKVSRHVMLLVAGAVAISSAGEVVRAPDVPKYTDFKYSDRVNAKSSFCELGFDVGGSGNDSAVYLEALKGMSLSVLVNTAIPGQDFFNWASYDAQDQKLSGYLPEVLDEMASMGGFSWRGSFGLLGRDPAISKEAYARWGNDNFDLVIMVGYLDRRAVAAGLTMLAPFLNMDTHLLVRPRIVQPSHWQEVFSFFAPFDMTVWFALGLVLVITGVLYMWVERSGADFEGVRFPALHAIYLSMTTYHGGAQLTPGTGAGKVLNFSFSFMVLLLVSTYTANLASLLVVNASYSLPVQSIEQAAAKSKMVCTAYPDLKENLNKHIKHIKWDLKVRPSEVYDGLRDGSCKVGAIRQFLWQKAKHMHTTNPGCQLYMLPDVVKSEHVGWLSLASGGKFCDGKKNMALNLILLEMLNGPFFLDLKDRYYTDTEGHRCPDGLPSLGEDSPSSMPLKSVSGIFFLYLVGLVVAIAAHIGGRQDNGKNSSDSDSERSMLGSDRGRRLSCTGTLASGSSS